MKKININLKDRKVLTLGLCLVVVCVFTLTVAYSALSAVLTISGNARVSAADWDIYLSNPKVVAGSKTLDLPVIKTNSTLEFETTLNMPGDFYEFTVDVVNNGTIDAMIENVVKNPELTAEQAKYLKYEVSYQNGELINTKQLLEKNTSMPIKVRIEYRKDLLASDLPTGQVILDLSLTLEYVQSDGSGSNVIDNGVDYYAIGTEKCFGSECFYIISSDEENVTMLAKYNLNVGGSSTNFSDFVPFESPTGLQDVNSRGIFVDADGNFVTPIVGTVLFSNETKKGEKYSSYNGSLVEEYVNTYVSYLESQNLEIVDSRLIMKDDLKTLGCDNNSFGAFLCKTAPNWVYSSSYWTMTPTDSNSEYALWVVLNDGSIAGNIAYQYVVGVRPVIVVPKDYFN